MKQPQSGPLVDAAPDQTWQARVTQAWLDADAATPLAVPTKIKRRLAWCMRDKAAGWGIIQRLLLPRHHEASQRRFVNRFMVGWLDVYGDDMADELDALANRHMGFRRWLWLARRIVERNRQRQQFVQTLSEGELERIALDWMEATETLTQEVPPEIETPFSHCMLDRDAGWAMIRFVTANTSHKNCLLTFATWYIESWLSLYDDDVIERVEALAQERVVFQRLLSCLYQQTMSTSVYRRVRRAALDDGYFDD